jgi:hypothetical protein
MAIGSEVFGRCVGEIFISLGFKNAGILLCCVCYEVYFGRESGSISAVDVGDGARYWRLFWAVWE